MAEINIPISTKVPIDKAFKHEHRFNDWLCDDKILAQLSKKAGLKLSSPIRELYILQGRVDIVCEEEHFQDKVIIESHLEKIDLDHLVRLIHYSIELNSATAILIAAEFTDIVLDFVSIFNKVLAHKLNIIVIEVSANRLSTGGYTCNLDKIDTKQRSINLNLWEESADFKDLITKSCAKMANNKNNLADNLIGNELIAKYTNNIDLAANDELIVLWWPKKVLDLYYIHTLFAVLYHQPKNFVIMFAETPDRTTVTKLANFYVLTKHICNTTLIDTSKLNAKNNFAIYLDIYQLLSKNPSYQKHKIRNEFWERFYEEYKKHSNTKVKKKPEICTGLFKYIRKTSKPRVKIISLFCTRECRFFIDIRMKHKQEFFAENLYMQLLDDQEKLANELADHVVLDWARNRLTVDNEYIIRCNWTQRKIRHEFALGKIERAAEVAKKLAIVEKVFTPYINELGDFVL